MNLYQSVRDKVAVQTRGITLNIDLMNSCPLRCPTCGAGIYASRGGKRMPFDLFKQILDKAQSESKVRLVQLYMYSDPCMHPELDKFISELTSRGIKSQISTMLQSMTCDMEEVIEARPTEFRVSFSGWKHLPEHQRGGTVSRFLKNLERVSLLPRYKETKWFMFFHVYKDNRDETEAARLLAKIHGFDFAALPAIFMPCEKVVEKNYSEEDKRTISGLLTTPEEAISQMKVDHGYCVCQTKQIAIDALGRVYLCQLVYEDRFILGNYLSMSLRTIQGMILEHPFCGKCLNVGGHAYQLCFAKPYEKKNPVNNPKSRGLNA